MVQIHGWEMTAVREPMVPATRSIEGLGEGDASGWYPPGTTVVTFWFDDDVAGTASCSATVEVLPDALTTPE